MHGACWSAVRRTRRPKSQQKIRPTEYTISNIFAPPPLKPPEGLFEGWASVADPPSSVGSGGQTASSSSHETFRAVSPMFSGSKKPGAAPSGRSLLHPEGSLLPRRGMCLLSNPAHCARAAVLSTCTPNPLLMRSAALPGAVRAQSNSLRDSDFCGAHFAPLLAVGPKPS